MQPFLGVSSVGNQEPQQRRGPPFSANCAACTVSRL